ncbi:nitric-oxide reductase large subunit, partial [Neisseria sp. P0001.S004]
FFDVFATAAFAFIFYNLGFVRSSTATASTLAAASIFMLGGIPGTLHHMYFSGSTSASLTIGACFSAWVVVALILVGR